MALGLYIVEIPDDYARENFKRIDRFLNETSLLKGQWKFFEITILGAVTNLKYKHLFKFIPKDVIQTSLTGAGALTWNYSRFDRDYLDLTTTAACVIRCFVGSYDEGAS